MKNLIIICSLAFLSACYYDNEEELYKYYNQVPCDTSVFTFSQKVYPLIDANCNSCHSNTAMSGNISSEGYANVKTLVDNGKLWGVISYQNGFSPMPKNGAKLSDCNLGLIKKWIDAGAPNN